MGRLHFGALILALVLLAGLPGAEAVKPYTAQVNNTIVWNMAKYPVLSTTSMVADSFPFAGLKLLGNVAYKTFDETINTAGKYTYSGE
jgi:hypothetical protein